MARPLRIQYPGALYHITSRGNERKNIYLEDSDRKRFLRANSNGSGQTIGNDATGGWLCGQPW